MLREYSPDERLCDAIVHLLGVGASVAAIGALLVAVIPSLDVVTLLSAVVYGAALVTTLGLSAAYNLTTHPFTKERIRRYDHAAIFVMIAGTYTPFALALEDRSVGLGLLALVWVGAIAGIMLKLLRPRRFERSSLMLYLGLGWIGLAGLGVLIAELPASTLILLGAGGLLYTAGVGFHLWERLRFQNAIWHALVLAAAGCHFVAVFAILAR